MSTYSFIDVVAMFVGPTGSANLAYGAAPSDEGISFEAAGDKNTMTVGPDGSVMHSLHADKTGRVIIRLLKTSPINAVMHRHYDVQTTSAALHGQNTIICQQKASGDVTTARQVAFKHKPTINYQKEGGIIEWELDAGFIDTVLGQYPTS